MSNSRGDLPYCLPASGRARGHTAPVARGDSVCLRSRQAGLSSRPTGGGTESHFAPTRQARPIEGTSSPLIAGRKSVACVDARQEERGGAKEVTAGGQRRRQVPATGNTSGSPRRLIPLRWPLSRHYEVDAREPVSIERDKWRREVDRRRTRGFAAKATTWAENVRVKRRAQQHMLCTRGRLCKGSAHHVVNRFLRSSYWTVAGADSPLFIMIGLEYVPSHLSRSFRRLRVSCGWIHASPSHTLLAKLDAVRRHRPLRTP